jgi:hypothetical protein
MKNVAFWDIKTQFLPLTPCLFIPVCGYTASDGPIPVQVALLTVYSIEIENPARPNNGMSSH